MTDDQAARPARRADPSLTGAERAGAPSLLPANGGRLRTVRRVAPALALFVLAPLVGEYLLGNVAITQIVALAFLAPLYGGGALLIREAARRTARGWPMILLLALAYGLLEAGLLDQSLFNPSFEGQHFQSAAHIPGVGISAYYGLAFLGGHVIWSISVPIALIEGLVPDRAMTPWLARPGLAVTALVFAAGCGLIFYDQHSTERFTASPPQLVGTILLILTVISVAATTRRRPPQAGQAVPPTWAVAVGAFVTTSLFFALVPNWWGVATGIVLLTIATFLIRRWSRRTTWTPAHRFALAAGALMTYVWGGFTLPPPAGTSADDKLAGNAILAVAAVTLVAAATVVQYRAKSERVVQP